MTIERRRTTVTLYPGNFQAELSDLADRAMAAQRAEESGQRRASSRSKAVALAKEHDELLAVAEASAIKVELLEISNTDWQKLADEHPPRKDEQQDSFQGINMKTFPQALLRASMVDGQVNLDELSRVHYIKLENAAWTLHSGDDALPKFSLVSQLMELRELSSRQPHDSE